MSTEAVMQGSDWVAIAGIAGTLLGIVVGAGVTLLIEERRAKRERRARFGDQRRNCYATFLGISGDIAMYRRALPAEGPFHEKMAEFMRVMFELRILGRLRVRTAAVRISNLLTEELWTEESNTEWSAARDEFFAAARQELEIEAESA